ncbi:MAG: TonB-dependent receptor [Pseudomonadales bacterium]
MCLTSFRRLRVVTISTFFCGFCAFADEEIITEIIVSASRLETTEQPVHVLEIDDQTGPLMAVDLLRGISSVAVSQSGNRGSLTQLRLRGAEANHVMVLIDGVQANDPAIGSEFNFGTLHGIGIRRIEVLNGPQSAVHGANALAGIIFIDTTPDADRTSAYLGIGTEQTITSSIDFARVKPGGHISTSIASTKSDGTNVSLFGNENDAFKNNNFNFNAKRSVADWTVKMTSRLTRTWADFDPTPYPAFVPVDGDLRNNTDQRLIGVSGAWSGSDYWTPTVHLANTRARLSNVSDGSVTDSSIGKRRNITFSNNFSFWNGQRLNVTVGHQTEELLRHGVPSAYGDPNQSQQTRSFNIAAEYLYTWQPVAASFSIRHDQNSLFEDATTFGIGGSVLLRSTKWFARIASGIKNPSFTERFGYTPDTFVGNPDLTPESSVEFQVGVRRSWRDLNLSLVYFDANLRDEIDGFFYDSINMGFTARNISGTSHRSGTEATVEIQRGSHSLDANYSVINSTESGRREVRRPRTLGRINYTFRVGNRWRLAAVFTHTGSQIDIDYSTYPGTRRRLDPYQLVNMGATFHVSPHLHLQLFVENLFNAKSQDVFGYRSPGTAIHGGIRASL